jgi:DNA-binding GntR family transcriptional regulator
MTSTRGTGDPESAAAPNKQETVYELIRGRIKTGAYGPGQRLVIAQLASEFGVSQFPVREAVRRLEAESLITYTANAGPSVASFSPERWAQLFESVAVLEGYTTALAAPFVTPGDLDKMRQCNQSIRTALRSLDLPAVSRGNRQFHAIVLARCPNQVLTEQLAQLQTRLDSLSRSMFARDQAVLLQLLGPKAGATAIEDHQQLITALRTKRSAATIEQLTREHILVHLRAAREILTRNASGAGPTPADFAGM